MEAKTEAIHSRNIAAWSPISGTRQRYLHADPIEPRRDKGKGSGASNWRLDLGWARSPFADRS